MPNTNPTPNMSLPVPIVGVDPGPDWANNVNSCFTILDAHTHSSGSGVQITPSGMNINSDLPFNSNNGTQFRSLRFTAQGSPLSGVSDLGCVYESGVDLYYNDGNGNQVRITQNGGVAGSPGSIANLTSPASASYVAGSSTFVWQSAASTAANMDCGSVIFRKITSGSSGITISPPSSLASNYTITLPSLPAQQSFMTLDQSGNMAAPWTVDNSTLAISGSNVIVKSGGITSTQIAAQGVAQSNIYIKTTGTTVSAGNLAVSAALTGSTSSGTFSDIPNSSITITTTGRPVLFSLVSNGSTGQLFSVNGTSYIQLLRGVTVVCINIVEFYVPTLTLLDLPAAGTYTYKLQWRVNDASLFDISGFNLIAYELN